jgi:uncharacterized membrane protein YeaQ/YmgE (transglycosylase-associated protein family)
MDNKISFLAGYILTAATTISAAGFLNAIILGLLGGFFGLLGKEAYYYVRDEYKAKSLIAKAWIAKKIEWLKSKINAQ